MATADTEQAGTIDRDPGPGVVLSVDRLTKTFDGGRIKALDRVSLAVTRGQLVVLIGKSGSGKSTLLRQLTGLQPPTSGSVKVLGTNVVDADHRELRHLRRRVGVIFQQFHLVGRMTCLENVLTGALGRLRGPRYGVWSYPLEMRKEALAQLERVGLADRAFQRADTLSGGQQQRVAIARTLMQHAEIVLADEPVASLDPESSRSVMETLFRICSEDGLTVLCSLHQVDLALGWADRLVGMREGKVVLDGPAKQLTEAEAMDVYQDPKAAGIELDRLANADEVRASAAAPSGRDGGSAE